MITKYRSKKCEIDGIKFDSKKEGNRYLELKKELELGNISNLELQKKYVLQPSFKKDGKTYREIAYLSDFTYIKDGKEIIEDVKGSRFFLTDVYKMKKKMFEYVYPDKTIIEIY